MGAALRVIWTGALYLGLVSAVAAADLLAPASLSACIVSPQSTIMSLPAADLRATLDQDYALAKAEVADPVTIGSASPRFTWAQAAKLQCAVALGYIKGGAVDADSARKCDCFTQHMASFR